MTSTVSRRVLLDLLPFDSHPLLSLLMLEGYFLACPSYKPGNLARARAVLDGCSGVLLPITVCGLVVNSLDAVSQTNLTPDSITRLASLLHCVVGPLMFPTREGDDFFDRGVILGVRWYHDRLAGHGSSPAFEVASKRGLITTVVRRQRWSRVHRILPRKA